MKFEIGEIWKNRRGDLCEIVGLTDHKVIYSLKNGIKVDCWLESGRANSGRINSFDLIQKFKGKEWQLEFDFE